MDYSKTLNLPKTSFSMKANLVNREPEFLKEWEKEELYKQIIESRSEGKTFILHDGPPYANGHIHLGHSLNKILKDIILKFKSMEGYKTPYIPGWDCHGLPIELQVVKELKGKEISKDELRQKCREYAKRFVSIQKEEFKRLGIFGDWENPYLTMSEEYEQTIVDSFGELFEKGYIYRGLKPVYWCPSCKTALAEAEVEYYDAPSPSITVKFPVKMKNPIFNNKDAYWLIWTTTPWTLPANVAIAIHPDYPYVAALVEWNGKEEWWILADALLDHTIEIANAKLIKKKKIEFSELIKLTALHPFLDRDSKITYDKFVTMDTGTGCVHIAPGHGQEDYVVGSNFNLPIISPVDGDGNFTDEVGISELVSKNVFESNEYIINLLKKKGLLVHNEEFTHSYPHCWRCKSPIIFRATYQWFLNVDHKDLRGKSREVIKKVKWIPEWGEERLGNMLEARPDWCLSRQRSWGVPIPAFYCNNCGETIITKETLSHFSKLVKEKGVDIWFTLSANELLPPDFKCPKCGSTDFSKEQDILDVWFDSGVSHFAVLEKREELHSPADMYLEGSDQYRGWFQSSLLPSVALRERAPYKIVLTHGFTLDAEGKAMHKSAGNVISPKEIINKYGADILRLWVSSLDYKDDVRIGDEILKRLVESYRKIRNTLRYILGNINNFEFDKNFDYSNVKNFDEFDLWAIAKLIRYNDVVRKAYDKFEFHIIYHNTVNFCSVTLSNLYFDILKDRLYVEPKDSFKGKSSRYTLLLIFRVLTKLLAPIMPFTAEDAWKTFLTEHNENITSIHLETFEELTMTLDDLKDYEEKWDRIFSVRDEVNKALEKAKTEDLIGHTLEAKVIVIPKKERLYNFLQENKSLLPFAFIVSQVEISNEIDEVKIYSENDEVKVVIQKAEGDKCMRCWNYSPFVGQSKEYPELCERCVGIVKRDEGE